MTKTARTPTREGKSNHSMYEILKQEYIFWTGTEQRGTPRRGEGRRRRGRRRRAPLLWRGAAGRVRPCGCGWHPRLPAQAQHAPNSNRLAEQIKRERVRHGEISKRKRVIRRSVPGCLPPSLSSLVPISVSRQLHRPAGRAAYSNTFSVLPSPRLVSLRVSRLLRCDSQQKLVGLSAAPERWS